jgi:hypothetical protein
MIKNKSLVVAFRPTFSFVREMANEWNIETRGVDMATKLHHPLPFICTHPPPHCGREKFCPPADFYEKLNWRPFGTPSAMEKMYRLLVADASRQSGLSHFRTETHFPWGRNMTKLIHSIMVKKMEHFVNIFTFINYLVIFRMWRVVTRTLTTFTM